MQDKANGCITSKNAVKAIQEFIQIINNKKSNIISLSYYQGQVFQKLRVKESFVSMVLKLNVSKSTIVFKIALKKLIDDFPKIKDSSLSIHYFFKKLKMIKEFCKKKR